MTATLLKAVIGDDAPQAAVIRGNQTPQTVPIKVGASLSGAFDLGRYRIAGFVLPSNWVAANLTFQASVDDVTYGELTDDGGVAVSVTGTAGAFIALKSTTAPLFAGVRFIKVRSGTSGSPVVQSLSNDTPVILVLEPSP